MTEVFRIIKFDPNKEYEIALKTYTEGKWPNERHYTTNKLEYLGKWVRQERWGYGDGSSGSEIFNNEGEEKMIVYDYAGNTCFREINKNI